MRGYCRFVALIVLTAGLVGLHADEQPVAVTSLKLRKMRSVEVRLHADRVVSWEDERETVYLLDSKASKVVFEQGVQQVWADRLIVWETLEGFGPDAVRRIRVYAENSPRLEVDGKKSSVERLLLETETEKPIDLSTRPTPGQDRSDPLYRRGLKARGRVPPAEVKAITTAVVPANARVSLVEEDHPITPVALKLQPDNPPPLAPPPGGGTGGLTIVPPVGPPQLVPLLRPGMPKISFGPRSNVLPDSPLPIQQSDGSIAVIITGGVRMFADFPQDGKTTHTYLDIEADRVVFWRAEPVKAAPGTAPEPIGLGPDDNSTTTEIYLAGNVILRYGSSIDKRNADGTPLESKILRADEVYYNISKGKAVARNADLELSRVGIPYPAHIKAQTLEQRSTTEFLAHEAEIASSKLPSDPGLKLTFRETEIVQQKVVRRNFLGLALFDRTTGGDYESSETTFTGKRLFLELANVPVFYLPYLAGNVERPLGPLQNISFRQDNIFGTQLYTTFNLFELFALKALPGEAWSGEIDYMSKRGLGIGTDYNYGNQFDPEAVLRYRGMIRAYGVDDHGNDNLGGPRSFDFKPTANRGRFLWRDQRELIEGLDMTFQLAYVSDRNFIEQYYKYEWDQGPNQETFINLAYRDGPFFASALVEPYFYRPFVQETTWLPRFDFALIGQSIFDRFTYNAWSSFAYAERRQIDVTPGPRLPTETPTNTARLDLMQELTLPFEVGPIKVVPYGKVDITYYSNDVNDNSRGRFYGAIGNKTSLPFSRLYEDVESDTFNLKGLYHKLNFFTNYYASHSDTPYTRLPLLDRIYDDATDQARRNLLPYEDYYIPGPTGLAIRLNDPRYDPQRYLIRRATDINPESLDTEQVLQFGLQQRFQTKRGYPGLEHTVDYFILNTSASYFPNQNRDNAGHALSFLEYDMSWYVGDRTNINSAAWVDPYEGGTRYYKVGLGLSRPDRTSFSIDYHHIDPLNSRLLSASVDYAFSEKYSMRAYTAYDFGINKNLSSGLIFTRRWHGFAIVGGC